MPFVEHFQAEVKRLRLPKYLTLHENTDGDLEIRKGCFIVASCAKTQGAITETVSTPEFKESAKRP